MKKTIHIDEYGHVAPNGKYKVTLSGSYQYSPLLNAFWYDVEKIEPKIELSRVLLREVLV
jgi:hypothetical protein